MKKKKTSFFFFSIIKDIIISLCLETICQGNSSVSISTSPKFKEKNWE